MMNKIFTTLNSYKHNGEGRLKDGNDFLSNETNELRVRKSEVICYAYDKEEKSTEILLKGELKTWVKNTPEEIDKLIK